jgi:high-affinity K+ transport system ATPase subunit B
MQAVMKYQEKTGQRNAPLAALFVCLIHNLFGFLLSCLHMVCTAAGRAVTYLKQ